MTVLDYDCLRILTRYYSLDKTTLARYAMLKPTYTTFINSLILLLYMYVMIPPPTVDYMIYTTRMMCTTRTLPYCGLICISSACTHVMCVRRRNPTVRTRVYWAILITILYKCK